MLQPLVCQLTPGLVGGCGHFVAMVQHSQWTPTARRLGVRCVQEPAPLQLLIENVQWSQVASHEGMEALKMQTVQHQMWFEWERLW